jgi:hypothetical protein
VKKKKYGFCLHGLSRFHTLFPKEKKEKRKKKKKASRRPQVRVRPRASRYASRNKRHLRQNEMRNSPRLAEEKFAEGKKKRKKKKKKKKYTPAYDIENKKWSMWKQ